MNKENKKLITGEEIKKSVIKITHPRFVYTVHKKRVYQIFYVIPYTLNKEMIGERFKGEDWEKHMPSPTSKAWENTKSYEVQRVRHYPGTHILKPG